MAYATDSGSPLTGNPVNDGYGSKTAAAGTPITRVVAPRPGVRAKVSSFEYKAGTTAHTVTFLTVLTKTKTSTDAASGQATIPLASIPTAADGSALATGDWFVIQHEDGTWGEYLYSSISGLTVTLTTNLTGKVLKGATVFLMGAPADHPDRQYLVDVSDKITFYGGDARLCAASANADSEPILVHSNNATVAGNLKWVAFTYGNAA